MEQIAENILIETGYTGVTLGAIVQSDRFIYIDAPLLPEHARLWRIAVTARKKFPQQIILMDAHLDRTIGSRYIEGSIIAQEETLQTYRNRPITFKPISQNSGSDWESIKIQNGFRWIYPEIVFSQRLDLHQSELHVDLSFHPGPSVGCTWVDVPERKVVFVGDTVYSGTMPFLKGAQIGPWLGALDKVEEKLSAGYQVVGGRCGLVKAEEVEATRAFLLKTQTCLSDYAASHETDEQIDALIPALIAENHFKVKKAAMDTMNERLSYGLHKYFRLNFMHIDDDIIVEEDEAQEGGETAEG